MSRVPVCWLENVFIEIHYVDFKKILLFFTLHFMDLKKVLCCVEFLITSNVVYYEDGLLTEGG